MRITNGKLLTMEGQCFEKGYIDFENGVITSFGDMQSAPAASGEVLDAEGGYIMPGMIDAHTHIGISEESVRSEGEDCNEITDPVTPQMRAIDGIYPSENAFVRAVEAGVTSAVIGPGSANVIGGQMCFAKLWGDRIDDMIVKAPCAMKMALGENPKRCYGSQHKTPQTRMASAFLMREAFIKTQRYMQKLEKDPDGTAYDAKCEALIPVLRRELVAHIHCHRADDILTAIRIASEFNIRYNIIHTTDGAACAEYIRQTGVIPVVGPVLMTSGKPETAHHAYGTAGALEKAGIEVALTTDHPVAPLDLLPVSAALCVRDGLSMEGALRGVTINAAKVGGVDDRVGSIKVGKDADIVVFTGHPFEFLSKTRAVFVSGKRVK